MINPLNDAKALNKMKYFLLKNNIINVQLWLLLSSLFFSSSLMASDIKTTQPVHPFRPGEKLSYHLRWNFIQAGSATVEVLPMTKVHQFPAYHFLLTARTTPFVDMFYKVRDRVEGCASQDMTHSLLYKKIQREGHYKRDVIVNFDWARETAQYQARGKKRPPIFIYPGTFDPISICFYFRRQHLAVGKKYQAPITDGKRCLIGSVEVIGRQTIKVPGGEYDTFLVKPEIKHFGGVFKRSEAATLFIWVTADERHLPVKVSSKVKVGKFLALLVSVEEGG